MSSLRQVMLKTHDMPYLCCKRDARLEVSLAKEVAERAVKVCSSAR